MEVLRVMKYPASVLKTKAHKVEKVDDHLENIVDAMFRTMIDNDGVGLAAPQVNHSIRLFVAAPQGKKGPRYTFINPEIFSSKGRERGPEGCLSFPGVYGTVERYKEIGVRFSDLTGKQQEFVAKDFLARIIQHENDHLEGILFIEHLGFGERKAVLDEYKSLQRLAL